MKITERLTAHADVSEKMIERHLSLGVAAMGGVSLKYSNPGMAGYPDRVCLLPGGVTLWVELKSKGGRPRPLQKARVSKLLAMGHEVHVCDSREAVDALLERYKKRGSDEIQTVRLPKGGDTLGGGQAEVLSLP